MGTKLSEVRVELKHFSFMKMHMKMSSAKWRSFCPGREELRYHASWGSMVTLQWRYNDHDGVSNHQPHGCLLNRLFRRRSKKTSKLRVTGLCVGNSPGPVNSPHKGPVTRKMFPFDVVIIMSVFSIIRLLDTKDELSSMKRSSTSDKMFTEQELRDLKSKWVTNLTLYVLNFSEGTKTYIYILCHSSTLIWHRYLNPSSSKRRTYTFYIVNIMAADVLKTQGARASATMILT